MLFPGGAATVTKIAPAGLSWGVGVVGTRGKAAYMDSAGDAAITAGGQQRRRVVVDVILLLISNGRILLRERANTGYGDGAYEPPTGQLADRETIVETAIRVASAEAGIGISAQDVSLAHVMHDVSGSGRIAFFLTADGWESEHSSPGVSWFGLGDLPTNMLDRSRVALRNYAEGMRFSTYPAFEAGGAGLPSALAWTASPAPDTFTWTASPWPDAFSA